MAIVEELAKQRGLEEYIDQLKQGAEQWAIARRGRSPRCARQFMNSAEAKIKLGRKLNRQSLQIVVYLILLCQTKSKQPPR